MVSFLFRHRFVSLFFIVFVIFVFLIFPNADIFISNLFFIDGSFLWYRKYILLFNRIAIYFIGISIFLCIVYNLYASYKIFRLKCALRHVLYTFSLMFVWHTVFVHEFFKKFFGRARPDEIIFFSGKKIYSLAFYISNQCVFNCSFISGDMSIAFVLFGIILAMRNNAIITKKIKGLLLDLSFFIGIIVGFFRVCVGRHFFTDVFIAMVFTIIFSIISYRVIFGKVVFAELKDSF